MLQFLQMAPDPFSVRQWDAAHVWHPFTQMQEYLASEPLVVVSAEGHYLIDDRGRRLFDGTSALWCNLFGHRVPEIDAAIIEQLGRFAHTTLLGTTHPAVVAEDAVALLLSMSHRQDTEGLLDRLRRRSRTGARARRRASVRRDSGARRAGGGGDPGVARRVPHENSGCVPQTRRAADS